MALAGAVERGAAGATTSLNYAAVGDSITSVGVTTPDGWADLYAANLDAEFSTTTAVTNLGANGATSAQILASVLNDSSTRSAIASANLVTLEAGFNDFFLARGQYIGGTCGGSDNQDCLQSTVAAFGVNWDRLVSEIHALAPSAAMRTMDIYYWYAGLDEASGIFGVLNPYLSQMNSHILSNPGGPVADVHSVFNGPTGADDPYTTGYLLPDHIHPNWLGHAVIYSYFVSLGWAGISPVPFATDPPKTATASLTATATVDPARDTDGDGCPDAKESGPDHHKGGQRDPNNSYDWYSVPYPALRLNPAGIRGQDIGITRDLIAVLSYVGLNSTSPDYMVDKDGNGMADGLQYDRSPSTTPGQPWRSGPPDGGIGMTSDVLAMLAQVGDMCG